MFFTPEFPRTLKCAFLPLACECTLTPGCGLMVNIFDVETGRVALRVENIALAKLATVRAVAKSVVELRYDLRTVGTPFDSMPTRFALVDGGA